LSLYQLDRKEEAMCYIAIAREKNNNEETSRVFTGLMNEIINRR
jgi:hypothetical protein